MGRILPTAGDLGHGHQEDHRPEGQGGEDGRQHRRHPHLLQSAQSLHHSHGQSGCQGETEEAHRYSPPGLLRGQRSLENSAFRCRASGEGSQRLSDREEEASSDRGDSKISDRTDRVCGGSQHEDQRSHPEEDYRFLQATYLQYQQDHPTGKIQLETFQHD